MIFITVILTKISKYTNNEIKRTLDKLKIKYEFINTDKIFNKTIKLIIQGIIGLEEAGRLHLPEKIASTLIH